MKKNLFLSIVYSVFVMATMSSCDKKGCTDLTAANVCSKCNSDDGSCHYQGNIVVWWNQATAQNWTNSHVTSVIVYVDGASVGSETASTYWLSAPVCRDIGSITYSKSLGAAQTMPGTVVIKSGSTGTTLNTMPFTYIGGMCFQLQIQ